MASNERVDGERRGALRQIGTEDALAEIADYAADRAYLVQAEAERAQ